MATLSYWNSLLVLILFLNPNTDTLMETKTDQELMSSAKSVVEKLKTIQKRCKENNIDLKTVLSKKEYKDYQASLVYVKTYLPQIKADALALKSQPENKEPIDEDISEPAFIDAVLQWRKTLLKDLKTTKAKYAEVAIDPSKFSASIGSNLSALPLNTSLYKEWENIVAKIPSPSTGAIIFEALIQNSSETWVLTENIEKLTAHYRKAANKKVYKQYEDTRIDAALPQITLFITAIEASADSKDPNLPKNVANKAEANQAKAEAYQKILNAWLDREIANLSIETGDDTVYVDMSLINIGTPRVSVHNLPLELKSNLLTAIINEAKKAGSRRQSVKNLKNIAIGALNTFHTQNLHKEENYQALTIEEIEVIKFPTNISGWILDYKVSNKETDPKIKEYQTILENWYAQQQSSLDSTNASEHLEIDPVSLDISSNLAHSVGIPSSMHKELLSAIKTELIKEEKAAGRLNFNQAAGLSLKPISDFYNKYNVDNTIFDYKSFSLEEIRKFNFPTGIHHWIKDAEAPGVKKDIKKDIKTQLDITFKNDIKFNLEALIKELKIDMGGITINNDFNFDNDVNLTYNNLDLILKELIEINKKNKKGEDKPVKRSEKTTSNLLIEGFNVSYLFSTYFEADLNLGLNLTKNSKSTYTFGVDSLELKNKGGNILKIDEFDLNSVSVSIPKNATKTMRIGFSITYNYNLGQTTIKMVRGGYKVVRKGAEVGVKAGTPFVQGWAKLNYDQTNVGGSQILGISEGSHDMTFTDHYVFELEIENKENSLDIKSKNISFADKKYNSVCYEEGEMINLGQNIKTVK